LLGPKDGVVVVTEVVVVVEIVEVTGVIVGVEVVAVDVVEVVVVGEGVTVTKYATPPARTITTITTTAQTILLIAERRAIFT
jgi:hypothetical protein